MYPSLIYPQLFLRDKPMLCRQIKCNNRVRNFKHSLESASSSVKTNRLRSESDLTTLEDQYQSRSFSITHEDSTSTTSEDIKMEKEDSKLSSCCEENTIFSSHLPQSTLKIERSNLVLTKLRHDASILYGYQEATSMFHVDPEVLSRSISPALTQAIIDSAIIAMKRCDNTISRTNFLA